MKKHPDTIYMGGNQGRVQQEAGDPISLAAGDSACGKPRVTVPPSITGVPNVGEILTYVPGTWFAYDTLWWDWYSDGIEVQAGGTTYTVKDGDVRSNITIVERALSGGGGASSRSQPALPPPIQQSLHRVSWDKYVGNEINLAETGFWVLADTVTNEFFQDGVSIQVGGDDVPATQLAAQSNVTATQTGVNRAGTVTTESLPLIVAALGSPAPVIATPTTLAGTPAVGQLLTRTKGTFTGFTDQQGSWRRDGAFIDPQPNPHDTYRVTPADSGHTIVFLETGRLANATTGDTFTQNPSNPMVIP